MTDAMSMPAVESAEPRVLSRPEHVLSRGDVSTEALKVLYRLHRSGYMAYLVGGSVRDLLLGRSPKDFDIATNARPQEIRRLFRNSRIIGRRFRLVHVFFRGEIVEVATFRASPEPPESPDDWEEAAEEAAEDDTTTDRPPPQTDDVIFGSPAEDALRRDFTVNALFYNIADYSVIDHVGGIDDLENRVIRTIGDPDQRFAEDPVRMLRALEYAVRLGFDIDSETVDAIARNTSLITEASAPRLTYELLESLRSGNAAGIHEAWRKAGLFSYAFPDLPIDTEESVRVLEAIDVQISVSKLLPDPSLFGAFFLPRFFTVLDETIGDNGRVDNVSLLERMRECLEPAAASMHLSNQTLHLMHQGLFTLTKMRKSPSRGRQVLKLARQEYFPIAWDLHGLAAALGYLPRDVHRSWASAVGKVQTKDRNARSDDSGKRRRPRRRRPRRRR
jgi:poly(A) polymerase